MTVSTRPATAAAATTRPVPSAEGHRRGRAFWLTATRLARRVPAWHVLAAGGAVAFGITRLHASEWINVGSATSAMRVGAIAMAASVAFTLDDPTEPTLAGTPVAQWARRTVKLVPMIALLALVWVGLLAFAEATPALNATPPTWTESGLLPGEPVTKPESGWWLPIGALSIELATMSALVLAGAAWGSKLSVDRSGGLAGVCVLLITLLLIQMLPLRWIMLSAPAHGEDVWHDSHLRWAGTGAVALAIALWGNRDPGRHSWLRRRRTAVTEGN